MLIELIIVLIVGVLAGTITGLTPGIHINLVALFLVSASAFFLNFLTPVSLVVFIVAMSITHTFLDFIPSILLGAPDEDTSLSILPGHKFLLEGKGYEAIIYTLYGSSIAIPIILLLTPFFLLFLPQIFYYLRFVMFFILITASLYMILRDGKSRAWAFIIFMLSGFLGTATLNLSVKESLLPLLTGLFGASSLITSIKKKEKIPEQKISKLKDIKMSRKEIKNVTLAILLASPLCSFLPALGSSQAAVIGSDILGKTEQKEFLMLLGSVNTIVMGLSFVTLYSIQKARTGSAVAVSKLIENFTAGNLFIILLAILFSSVLAFFLTIFLSKFFAKRISLISYNKLSIFILAFLVLIVLLFSGFLGFLIFLTACFTGLVAISAGVRRTHLMGSLMLPSILLYLPFI
ncbi:MAG: tripartite tricarboxylate transporter permease [Nanoarchaeota archaeon]